MALSRAHISAKAADVAKLLVKKQTQVIAYRPVAEYGGTHT